MCGICGVFAAGDRGVDERRLLWLRDAMTHRGPDDAGHFIAPGGRVGLGSRRLSVIDPSPAGHMPMWNDAGTVAIVYNGECYNLVELRRQLEERGFRFRSRTDTECVLHLYEAVVRDGEPCERMLNQLRGMFAFAIWDRERGHLLLARDPLGIKPLYYARTGGDLWFASEARALIKAGCAGRELSAIGTMGYFALGSAPLPETPLRDVQALAPGHYLLLERGDEVPRRYFHLPAPRDGTTEGPQLAVEIRTALIDSVERHLVADRPVGIFLSGGIDSSAIVSLARSAGHRDLRTFTLVFDEQPGDDAACSRAIAQQFRTAHEEHHVRGSDALAALDPMIAALDLPSIDGLNTFLVARAARASGVVVALSGLGADELFGGYPSVRWAPRLARLARLPGGQAIGRVLERAGHLLGPGARLARLASVFGAPRPIGAAYAAYRGLFDPAFLRTLFEPALCRGAAFDAPAYLEDAAGITGMDAASAVGALELRGYLHNQLLRDGDAMSMIHSLELRFPFLDQPLVERLARVPGRAKLHRGIPKHLLLAALTPALPDSIWRRPKQGFSLPFATWLRNELRAEASRLLTGSSAAMAGICRPEALRRIWQGFLDGRVHWSRVWSVVVFGRWREHVLALSGDGR